MGYNIDMKKIAINSYMEILKNQNLLPSRKILHDNIDAHFRKMTEMGVQNLSDLKSNLSTAQKLSTFAEKTGISNEYLTILKREIGSLEQKPVKISEFPGISEQIISDLSRKGIKTSKDVYEMKENSDELQELNCLCNLVRINGVGVAAARTIYEGGYKSVDDIANAKAAELLQKMNVVNADKQYYKASLGEKDMQFIIDSANIMLNAEG